MDNKEHSTALGIAAAPVPEAAQALKSNPVDSQNQAEMTNNAALSVQASPEAAQAATCFDAAVDRVIETAHANGGPKLTKLQAAQFLADQAATAAQKDIK